MRFWVRWVVQRGAQLGDDQVDVDVLGHLLETTGLIMARQANVRRAHSVAMDNVQEPTEHLDEKHDELGDMIARIEQASA